MRCVASHRVERYIAIAVVVVPRENRQCRTYVRLTVADEAYLLETGRVVMSGPAEVVKNDENIRKSYLGY